MITFELYSPEATTSICPYCNISVKRERREDLISLPHSGQDFAGLAERGLGKCGSKGAGCGPG